MPEGPYLERVELTDLEGRPSAGIDLRGSNGIVHLTTDVSTARGCSSMTVELFHENEMEELLEKLRAAKDRAIHQLHNTGAPK